MEDRNDSKVEMKFEVEKDMKFEFEKEFYEYNRQVYFAFDLMMHCKSVKSLSMAAFELINSRKFGGKFWFPNLDRHSRSFNYGLHVPIELVKKLSSPSCKELGFTSKDRLDNDEIRIFENRYNMLKGLYPDVIFSCRDN